LLAISPHCLGVLLLILVLLLHLSLRVLYIFNTMQLTLISFFLILSEKMVQKALLLRLLPLQPNLRLVVCWQLVVENNVVLNVSCCLAIIILAVRVLCRI
jgi:hypothetical protein